MNPTLTLWYFYYTYIIDWYDYDNTKIELVIILNHSLKILSKNTANNYCSLLLNKYFFILTFIVLIIIIFKTYIYLTFLPLFLFIKYELN